MLFSSSTYMLSVNSNNFLVSHFYLHHNFSADAMRSEAGVDETLITVPQTSGFAAKFPSLKDESSSEEERKEAKEAKPAASVKKEASEQIEISFTPTIKPRKYSLKPEVSGWFHFRDLSMEGLFCG